MGGSFSVNDKIRPRELNDLRRFYSSDSDTSDDFKTQNRSTTDIHFLLILTFFLIILLGFIGYCVVFGDIFRLLYGYDNCGNVCGKSITRRNDDKITDEQCKGLSSKSPPVLIFLISETTREMERKCIADCNEYEGFRQIGNICVPKTKNSTRNGIKTGIRTFFEEVSGDFNLCWREFIYLCLISLGFTIILMILLRYFVGLVVWTVLIGVVIVCSTGSVVLWIMWTQSKDLKNLPEYGGSGEDHYFRTTTYFALAIIATIITTIVLLIIIVMRKRIKLVVQLFKEAGKALGALPLLVFQPILTYLFLILVVGLWFYFCLWIESAGHLTEQRPHVYRYKQDGWMKFTQWYNLFAMLWMCQFVFGCQHMVIAGAVSSWYFSRNKNKLDSPIYKSMYNLVRYHLGSVAMGSFVIALIQAIRIILKGLQKYSRKLGMECVSNILNMCNGCMCCCEHLLEYVNRNAYIEVATYGYSFCRGAKQSFKLLVNNVLRVAALNSIGDFILFLGKVLVVIATVLIGVKMLEHKEGLRHMWVPITLAGLFGFFVVHCFTTVYEMIIDTIFLCFCEDCEMNDGINKPYYMSRSLMEFVENSKKALEILDNKPERGYPNEAWKQSVPAISNTVD